MHLLPYDYLADRPADVPALSRLAGLIARLRAELPATLLLDSGDFLQGGPMGDLLGIHLGSDAASPHPMIAAMNALGYDAVTLGNHEFNYGLDYLLRCIAPAQFPVVTSNLVRRLGPTPLADQPLARPFALLCRKMLMSDGSERTLRIGILGLAPPQTVRWEAARLRGQLEARGIVEAARVWQAALRAQGADLVLALAHTGVRAGPQPPDTEHAAIPLAQLPGIDALLLGHVHAVFPGTDFDGLAEVDGGSGTLAGRPAVMAGHGGSHLGVIDLDLDHGATTGWRVAGAAVRVIPAEADTAVTDPTETTGSSQPCAEVRRAVEHAHVRTLAHVRSVIGHSEVALHSYFALLGDSPAQRTVAMALRQWLYRSAGTDLPAGEPVLVAVPGFRTGGVIGPEGFTDVCAGPLAMRHSHDLYPFPNQLAVLRLTGDDIREWLERVASLYVGLPPGGEEVTLTDGTVAGWNYDMIDGLDYRIDLSAAPLFDCTGEAVGTGPGRIRDLRCTGRPVQGDDRFVVVTSSFRANGGGPFRAFAADCHIPVRPTYGRDAVAALFRDRPRLAALPPGERRFVPQAGRSVIFETGPGALLHLGDIAAYRPEPCGRTRKGFLRLRLHL